MFEEDNLENLEDHFSEVGKINNKFRDFLRANDRSESFKLGFATSYIHQEDYYKIDVHPNIAAFDSRQYFIDHFEKGKGEEKLAEFANKNNVGLITY
jgi:hypothetical protein